jgi:hypothetical protein
VVVVLLTLSSPFQATDSGSSTHHQLSPLRVVSDPRKKAGKESEHKGMQEEVKESSVVSHLARLLASQMTAVGVGVQADTKNILKVLLYKLHSWFLTLIDAI